MDQDLFGNSASGKKDRRLRSRSRKARANPGSHQARQLELTPLAPALDDLVARLKPLHRRLEADLARTLQGDLTLQRQVEAACEDLSRQQTVTILFPA